MKICKNCYREITSEPKPYDNTHGQLVKSYVQHESYGCDTGCCGHSVYAEDVNGNRCRSRFEFDHPDKADEKEWGEMIAKQYFLDVSYSHEDSSFSND